MKIRVVASLSPDAQFRRKHGIAPKGKGPHAPSDYGLPLPPKGHALAKKFARAVLSRAHQAKAGGRFDAAAVDRQVKRAQRILGKTATEGYHYGPCAAECRTLEPFRSKAQQRFAFATKQPWAKKWAAATKRAPGGFKRLKQHVRKTKKTATESATREAMLYGGLTAPHDSHEHAKDAIEKAAKADKRFGRGDPHGDGGDWSVSVPITYPHTKKAVVSNSSLGKMWIAPYEIDGTGACALGEPTEATTQVVPAEAQATLASLRESGVENPVLMPFHLTIEVREGATIFEDDGSVRSLTIREGDGNPADNNYYQRSFVESLVPLLEGADCYYNHESESQARDLPERDVRDKAGWWETPTVEDVQDEHGGTVAGLWAKFHPRKGDPVVKSLLETTQEKMRRYPSKPPFVAFSINGYGAGAAGKSPRDGSDKNLLEVATRLKSVDMVTAAGAGGRPTFRESDTMKHEKGCKRDKTCACKPSREAQRTRESGDPFDSLVELDVRTPGEIRDDNLQLAESVRAVTRGRILAGPLGKSILEAAKLPANLNLKRATEAQLLAIDEAAGIAGEEYADEIVATAGDPEGDQAGAEADEHEHEDDADADGETGRAELTDEKIDEMDEDQLRAALKGARAGTGRSQESGRVAKLERTVAELTSEKRSRNREAFIDRTLDNLKYPEGPHRDLARAFAETARTPEEIAKRLRSYKEANITTSRREPFGNPGVVRESVGAGAIRLNTGVKR